MKNIKFIKTRNVKSPQRANSGDAGIDFYIPYPSLDFIDDFVSKNRGHEYEFVIEATYNDVVELYRMTIESNIDVNDLNEHGITIGTQILGYFIEKFGLFEEENVDDVIISRIAIVIPPHERILIPSGIRVWIEPKDSALIATNKSGVATKKGLVVGATTVDSEYTGEVHLSLINTNNYYIDVECGDKIVQFIHTPVILSQMTEITEDEYNEISSNSSRGSGGFGSTGTR